LAGALLSGKENAPTAGGTGLLMVLAWQFHGLVIWEWCAK